MQQLCPVWRPGRSLYLTCNEIERLHGGRAPCRNDVTALTGDAPLLA
jgi:hypothetical protein